jgi:hypothetical protein
VGSAQEVVGGIAGVRSIVLVRGGAYVVHALLKVVLEEPANIRAAVAAATARAPIPPVLGSAKAGSALMLETAMARTTGARIERVSMIILRGVLDCSELSGSGLNGE